MMNYNIEQLYKDIQELSAQIEELQFEAGLPGLWDNQDYAQKVTRNLNYALTKYEKLNAIKCLTEDLDVMTGWGMDISQEELNSFIRDLDARWTEYLNEKLFNGKYDSADAILTFHAGSGGTESCDFTDMMLRAISRWAESSGFRISLTDIERDIVAGVKSASLVVSGENAYGYAKALNGVFRLVRCSPFDAAGRRHTSFMAIETAPVFDDDEIIEVKIEDCDIETFRSGGKGGQYQNKTDSGVRLIHRPTGFIAECREERSQLQNKNRCLEKLRGMIFLQKEKEREEERQNVVGGKMENGWGSSICSIVLMPYQLVKDTRTEWTTSNTTAFLDGEMGDMINTYLEWDARRSKEQNND